MSKLFKSFGTKSLPDNNVSEVSGPQHIAIIMDGNSRWAKRRGLPTSSGHRAGVEAVRSVLQACMDCDVKVLTLFAFSSENWQRPRAEVQALMRLFSSYLKKEIAKLNDDGIRLRFIGARDRFSKGLLEQMERAEQITAANSRATLVLAVDYGGQWDIARAARLLAEQAVAGKIQPADINEQLLGRHLQSADLLKPDLCIRTAGEQRLSNFMLWQLAYAEYYFTDTLWPDFSKSDLATAIEAFRQRDRRYGGRDEELPESTGEATAAVDQPTGRGVSKGA